MSLPPEIREAVGRDLHAEFRRAREKELRPFEPFLAEWEWLAPEYRESSMLQGDDIVAKLALVGLEVVACEQPVLFTIPEDQVEFLAEVEHGRWVVERLLGGWRWGRVKDVKLRVSPFLVPWDQLIEGTKEWDRLFIRAIPKTLATYKYEVRKKR